MQLYNNYQYFTVFTMILMFGVDEERKLDNNLLGVRRI
jgi:hypothetical protein